MRLNFAGNSFICGHKSWKCAQNFLHEPHKAKISKMRPNLTANSSVFWRKNRENAPISFLWSLHGENFQNPSEFHGKLLRFWTQKWWKCALKSFCNSWMRRTSKMRLNFTANSFVFGRKNREYAPRTFSAKFAGKELPKCVWTSLQTTSFSDT